MQILYATAVFFKVALGPLFPLSTKGRHSFVCLFVFSPSSPCVNLKIAGITEDGCQYLRSDAVL